MSHAEKRLDLVLKQTLPKLGSLERLLLDYAACWGPDAVPKLWIDELMCAHHAGLVQVRSFGADPLAAAWAWLAQRRLLTTTDSPAVMRMHRLIHAHVAPLGNQPITRVAELAIQQADALETIEDFVPASWIPVCLETLVYDKRVSAVHRMHIGHILARYKLAHRSIQDAKQLLTNCLTLADQEIASNVSSEQSRHKAILIRMEIADIACQEGRFDQALILFSSNLMVFRSLTARRWHDEAVCHAKLAMCFTSLGDSDQAIEHYARSFDICQWRLDSESDDLAAIRQQCHCRNKMAELLRATQPGVAIKMLEDNELDLRQHDEFKRLRAMNLCDLAMALGPPRAEALLRESNRVHHELLLADSESSDLQRDCAIADFRLAMLEQHLGNTAAARLLLVAGLETMEGLLERNPSNITLRADAIDFCVCLAQIEPIEATRQLESARRHYAIADSVGVAFPENRAQAWPDAIRLPKRR